MKEKEGLKGRELRETRGLSKLNIERGTIKQELKLVHTNVDVKKICIKSTVMRSYVACSCLPKHTGGMQKICNRKQKQQKQVA